MSEKEPEPHTPDDADVVLSANVVNASDRTPVPGATQADLDDAACTLAFARAQQLMPRALRGAESDRTRLERLNFLDAQGRVTKAGLLAAGVYPQQFFPKLCVDVAVHPGTAKGTGGARRFLDRRVCEGTVGEMIDEAVAAVARNLRRASFVRGVGRTDELEIPEEVLREAVANAVMHREYNERFDGEAVAVDVFDDRVEVTNPGGLWGGKSRQSLADGRSCCRNATLMRLVSIVPLPDGAGSPAEGNGTGIPLMLSAMEERGLRPPAFRPSIDHFKVVLYRPQEGSAPRAARAGEETVRDLLERYGELSVRELERGSGLSVNQVRSRVRALQDAGVVVATAPATSRNRKYRLVTGD
jgi:ATP-dependent DNA helicase RecG